MNETHPSAGPSGGYVCPMHPDVTGTGPMKCPKCGMRLVPAAGAAGAEQSHGHGDGHPGHQHSAALAERADPPPGYVCPMHPEVTGTGPTDCPKCGMPLVPAAEAAVEHGHSHGHGHAAPPATSPRPAHQASGGVQYTCPMHPEILRDKPGRCPICGMHLEPMVPTAGDDTTMHEYRAMARRFWTSVPLSLALLSITVLGFPPLTADVQPWVELAIATPVVLWCAGQFFVWFADSVAHRSPTCGP